MNPIVSDSLGAIVRHVLTIVGMWFVTRGIIEESAVAPFVAGSASIALGVLWSLWQKYDARQKLVTALAAPKIMSEAELETKIQMGGTPSVTTPKTEIPL